MIQDNFSVSAVRFQDKTMSLPTHITENVWLPHDNLFSLSSKHISVPIMVDNVYMM